MDDKSFNLALTGLIRLYNAQSVLKTAVEELRNIRPSVVPDIEEGFSGDKFAHAANSLMFENQTPTTTRIHDNLSGAYWVFQYAEADVRKYFKNYFIDASPLDNFFNALEQKTISYGSGFRTHSLPPHFMEAYEVVTTGMWNGRRLNSDNSISYPVGAISGRSSPLNLLIINKDDPMRHSFDFFTAFGFFEKEVLHDGAIVVPNITQIRAFEYELGSRKVDLSEQPKHLLSSRSVFGDFITDKDLVQRMHQVYLAQQ